MEYWIFSTTPSLQYSKTPRLAESDTECLNRFMQLLLSQSVFLDNFWVKNGNSP